MVAMTRLRCNQARWRKASAVNRKPSVYPLLAGGSPPIEVAVAFICCSTRISQSKEE